MNYLKFSWLNPHCPMVFPWFSHGFPIVLPWFSHGFPLSRQDAPTFASPPSSADPAWWLFADPAPRRSAPWALVSSFINHDEYWCTHLCIYIYDIIAYMYKKKYTYGVWNIVNMHRIAQVHLEHIYIYQIVYPCICRVWKNVDLFMDLLSYTEP